MSWFWWIAGVAAVLFLASKADDGKSKKSKNAKSPNRSDSPRIKIESSESRTNTPAKKSGSAPITGTLKKVDDITWVINPRSPFPLTFTDIDEKTATKLKRVLDGAAGWSAPESLTHLITATNARCIELDEWVKVTRGRVREMVAEMVAASDEWKTAGERDRVDILTEFRRKAIASIEEKPSWVNGWETLLLTLPSDVTVDDGLVARFKGNSHMYEFYVGQLYSRGRVVTVKADDNRRPKWDELVRKDLAYQGKDIPAERYTNKLRMKDINEWYADRLEKPFRRKADAVSWALEQPDFMERLGKNITLRESFTLKDPEGIDMDAVAQLYTYARAQSELLNNTAAAGIETLETVNELSELVRDDGEEWAIHTDNCCNACGSRESARSKTKPKILPPFHFGCSCEVGIAGWRNED